MATPLRLLMVEDNPSDAESVLHALRHAGYDPVGARVETEQDFREHLQPAPEIILADFTMPEFAALRALEIVQECQLDIPFIIVSGTIGEERAVEVMQCGATDYVMKDRLGRLGQAVEQALARGLRKEEKLAIEHTAARLAAIVDSSLDAIVAKTLDGTITNWNPAAERLYGYSAQEIVGKNVAMLYPVGRRRFETAESFQKVVQQLSAGVDIPPYETVRVRKDGRRIEVLLSISPILDRKGGVIGASAIGRDITQGKRSERFLNAEQAVTGILAESSTLDEAGPRVLQTIAECFRWEIAVLWTVDRKANILRRMHTWHAAWADTRFTEALGQQSILERGMGIAGRTWSTGESVWETGISLDSQPAERSAMTCEGLRCGFGLPMRQGSEMVGVIEFYNSNIRELDQSLIATLDNIGSQVSQFCTRRRTEIALSSSEEQYRTLANSLPGGVYACTAMGECDYCNQWWCDYTGMTVDQVLHGGWADAIHPDDVKQTFEMAAESNRTGQPFQFEHRFRGTDGLYRWFLDRSVPLKDKDGRVIRWFGTCVDIDDRKRAEAERDRLLQTLKMQIQRMPLAYVLCDADFCIVDWNPAAERIFGYTRQEMLGVGPPFEKFVSRSFWPKGEELRTTLRAGSMDSHSIDENLTKNGSTIICQWLNTPLMDDAGKFVGYLGLAQDVTEQKSLQAQFQQAQKMEVVGQLAGGVAHDFNNLLTIISGYSELLLNMLPSNDPKREAVKAISEAGERAAGLTRQLLSFSRQAVLETKVLDLNEVVKDTEKLLRRMIGEDILVTAVLDPNISRIKIDPGQMGQVLMNLAVNARDAMPQGGKLTIETSDVELDEAYAAQHADCAPGRYVRLAVSDSGCGMTPEVKAHIFEPFFTTKEPGKGTGLGLATVYGIVRQSGGGIHLYSEPGHGTIFKIYLPAVDEQLHPLTHDQRSAQVVGGSETVLLVEDEDAVRAIALLALQTQGYTVLNADGGKKALGIIEKHQGSIDLLVTDVVMPGLSGRALAEALSARFPSLKVLYVSGYTDDFVIRHGILQAEVAFLHKPYTPLSLARKVRDVLNKSEGSS